MLNVDCFTYCKEGNHRTIHNCIQLCKQRLEHIQNGNAAYSSQMGGCLPLDDGEVRQCIVQRNNSYTHYMMRGQQLNEHAKKHYTPTYHTLESMPRCGYPKGGGGQLFCFFFFKQYSIWPIRSKYVVF